jgi:Ca2+-binding EF-hand superfamily protein
MTGSTQGSLSGDILMTLMAMQQQSSGAASSGASAASSTASASTLSASDPLQQLFSAMDTNGDGSVSESEMESYIEGVGGTQADADSLYSALNQTASTSGTAAASGTSGSSTAGITENQMASALQQAQSAQSGQAGGMHHHHRHGTQGGGDQADSVANTMMQALDTNDDGSVSESEFSSFVTANGGTATDAASDFSALDTSGSGSLTSADFATAWSNLQAQQSSQSSGTMVVSLLDAFAKANTTSTSTTSVSA